MTTVTGETERAYWVLLSTAAGIGPIRFQRLLQVCGSAEAAWQASDLELHAAGLERRTIASLKRLRTTTTPQATVEQLKRMKIATTTLVDEDYPPALRQIADPPPVLFVRGDSSPAGEPCVALVGTRQASSYGRAVTAQLAADLGRAGITVVSGLAKGIDTVAHGSALRAGGRTIAVLGNGLDQVYPAENRDLARQIVESGRGALVSEFPPGMPPDAANFPRRNRIIAGLARLVVIVEADRKSGALITADFALEQGREVMAVPGSVLSRFSSGTNHLLRQGATPATCAQDILDLLAAQPGELSLPAELTTPSVARGVPELGPLERMVWDALSADPCHVDELSRGLRRPAGEISAALAMLELDGLARQVGGMVYTRA